jgi:hypothetical protein
MRVLWPKKAREEVHLTWNPIQQCVTGFPMEKHVMLSLNSNNALGIVMNNLFDIGLDSNCLVVSKPLITDTLC